MRPLWIAFSLLVLLAACGERHGKMLQQLEALEQMNRADSVMTNDSLAEALADYFDRHGAPNERLRAHYILGRTYADLGDAPAALNAYLDAAECADTMAADCDFKTLSRVYGQRADVFYRQNLMQDYIASCDKAVEYAKRVNDTLQILRESILKYAGYNRLEQYDSIISGFDKVFDEIVLHFGKRMAAQYGLIPIKAFLASNQLDKCKYYLDFAQWESGYFGSANNVQKGREVFYYYKGCYFLALGQCDSAEFYFKKELQTGMDVVNQSMASRGLSLTFEKTHLPDSSAKYALLSYEMLDSVYTQMATAEVERMSALHNYSRHQTIANRERIRADQEKVQKERLIVTFVVLLLVIGGIWLLISKKQRLQAERYKRKVQELSKVSRDLKELEKQKTLIETLAKKEALQKSAELDMIRHHNDELERQIKEANTMLVRLRSEVMKVHLDRVLTNREIDTLLEEDNVYQLIKEKCKGIDTLTSSDWKAVEKLIKSTLPGFYNLITSRQSSLNLEKRQLCFLLRLHVGLKEASVLMGVNQSKISKYSRSILLHVFQEEGSGKDLIRRLEDIVC